MPLNSTQRPIFVYLRSKNDHKSCTLAGAKLTNEYTHRTNKNDPSTISVIPSQLCTFFRKRTLFVVFQKLSSLGKINFQRWKLSFPPLESFFSNGGNFLFQRWKRPVPTLEPKSSSVGTKEFLPWNRKVPPLELKSSKRGTNFGTRMYNKFSMIRIVKTSSYRDARIVSSGRASVVSKR